MPVTSSAPIALRYSVSIRPWAHAKLIQQNVLTVTSTESKSSNIASLVMLPAADHRKTPLPRTVGDLSGDRKVGVKTRKPDKFLNFPPTGDLESGRRVQVSGRRRQRVLGALGRPASRKRQGTKSRSAGPTAGSRELWGFQVSGAFDGGETSKRRDPCACARRWRLRGRSISGGV